MKSTLFYLRIFVFSLLLLPLASCSDDDNGDGNGSEPDPTLIDLVTNNPELSSLAAALDRSGLLNTLEGDGPFTVFAPTNAAFQNFLNANGFASLNDVPVDVLTQVLLNHVVDGDNRSTGLTTGYISSLSTAGVSGRNLSLFINTDGGVSVNGVADVILADAVASNGVAHVVDAVIGLPTIVDHAVGNPSFSSLVNALPQSFVDLLSGDGPFTVFAPDNDAFAAFDATGKDLNNILANHVLDGSAAFSGGLVNGYVETLAANADGDGINAYINTDNGVTINGGPAVQTADVVGTNGVIHAINEVIDIPTVVTFAVADPNFSSLATALTDGTPGTDFASVLSGDGPFTVFAPTNTAFDDILAFLGVNEITDIPEDTLTDVLLYHVTDAGNIRSSDLVDGDNPVPTLLTGESLTVILPPTDNGVNIADIRDAEGRQGGIVAVDVQAGNGVIHVINLVLLPTQN